jgi:hypothetical protein
MTQITLELPETLAVLSAHEQDALLQTQMRRLTAQVEESQQHIGQFEQKYGVSLAQFELEQLPQLDSLEAHQDYNDWFFWLESHDAIVQTLGSLYAQGKISGGLAAQILKCSLMEFYRFLSESGFSVIDYDPSEQTYETQTSYSFAEVRSLLRGAPKSLSDQIINEREERIV